jgi:hypothetical protein
MGSLSTSFPSKLVTVISVSLPVVICIIPEVEKVGSSGGLFIIEIVPKEIIEELSFPSPSFLANA